MWIKIAIASAFLFYSCTLDLKERRIPNKVWKWMFVMLIPFTVYEALSKTVHQLIFGAGGSIFMVTLAYLFYRIGAYGGADAKALIVIAITFPFYPEIPPFPILNKGFGIFAFSTLSNSVIAAPFMVVVFAIRNLIREGYSGLKEHPIGFLFGYRVEVTNFPKFHNLLQAVRDGKVVNLRRGIDPEGPEGSEGDELEALKKVGCKKVWATPQLPFLIFITAGFLLATFIGDLVVFLITLLL
jgi:preflagellin peptidase FlaK